MACAIPLLPERHLMRGYLIVLNVALQEGRMLFRLLRPFLAYVLRYWIRNDERRRWMSVHGSQHRTNNACESHNRVLNDLCGAHPNVYIFLSKYLNILLKFKQSLCCSLKMNQNCQLTSICLQVASFK